MKPISALASTLLLLISCSPHEKIDPIEHVGTEADFTFHVEVTAENLNTTRASVCLLTGDTSRDYRLTAELDGTPLARVLGIVNFSTRPIVTIPLSDVKPGEHTLKATLSYGEQSVTETVTFTEPLRIDRFNLFIIEEDGKLYLEFEDNPYDFKVSVRDSMSVEGSCTYRYCTYEDCTAKATKTASDSRVSYIPEFIPKKGNYFLIDKAAVESGITSKCEANYGWRGQWNSGCEGYMEYFEEFQGWSYYQLTKSEQHITLDIEGYRGTKVTIGCNPRGVYLNGKLISGKELSYDLQ